ncbi:hypothetical protein Leryth_009619 [Lithospermum erythrorhizon]|uniref:RNA metabolism protein n=1 Tax=Lithospermum erythrorhizon TaxID=34254 RepID=A0AAV3R8R6_LITER|nr:hypothetical protein Leryth_009619 [Lithospermum erythrorhizon]
MDTYDATKIILTRIQSLDPENASKIMGYILIQDLGDKELIRLAHGPHTLLLSFINKAKLFLRHSSNIPLLSQNGCPFSQLNMVPNGEKNGFHTNLKSPNSCNGVSRKCQSNAHYAKAFACNEFESSSSVSLAMKNCDTNLAIMSPSGGSDSVIWNYDDHSAPHYKAFHRSSCSVNDAYVFEDVDGSGQNGNFVGGWRPCMYYARGFCKNGSSCKFSHKFDDPSKVMACGPRHSFPHKRSTSAALMGEELDKFGPFGLDMNNFTGMGLDCNSSSRQIYLTFLADSPFTEEDVSNYFSIYGPVQDVRIPYQQKRMFGFVTFIYSETVILVLAKGNPHFVCDSRVLVKPYKEKGKVAEKKGQPWHQQKLLDRGEFPVCLSPSGFDSRELFDLPFGGRTFYNAKEMMLKNKLEEQNDLQQAIELQDRRMMDMHLMDLKNYNNHQSLTSFPLASRLTSRLQTHPQMFQNIVEPSNGVDVEVEEANVTGLDKRDDPAIAVIEKVTEDVSGTSGDNNDSEAEVKSKEADLRESLEHNLPDSLCASPTKAVAEHNSLSVSVPIETDVNYKAVVTSSCTTLRAVESVQSCHQMPRFPTGQGVVDM